MVDVYDERISNRRGSGFSRNRARGFILRRWAEGGCACCGLVGSRWAAAGKELIV